MNHPPDLKLMPAEEALFQDVNGEIVILDLNSEEYFGLNELGSRIWKLLEEEKSVQEVIDQLEQEYDAPGKVITQDLNTLLDTLLEKQLLVERPN